MLLKNQWVKEDIKKEIKKYLKTNDNEDTTTQNLGDAAKAVLREIHINLGLPQKTIIVGGFNTPLTSMERSSR